MLWINYFKTETKTDIKFLLHKYVQNWIITETFLWNKISPLWDNKLQIWPDFEDCGCIINPLLPSGWNLACEIQP